MRKLIIGFIAILTLASCSKPKEDDCPIPNYRVYFETPYADYALLQNVGSYKTYTNKGLYTTNTYLGYGGLLVYRSFDGVARCCDLACPYCYATIGGKYEIVPKSSLEAVCPTCNSVFNLQWGACIATSGPSLNNYMLKIYYCRDTGSTIMVGN